MRKRHVLIAAGAVALAAALAGGGIAIAGGDGEGTVTGASADRAIAAALEATGGGHANAVERESENGGTWEVEVTKPDGSIVDVRLDESFGLVGVEGDSEASDSGD